MSLTAPIWAQVHTVAAGGTTTFSDDVTITGTLNATVGGLGALSKIIGGASALNFRNNADTVTNMSISDAGTFALTPQAGALASSFGVQVGSASNTYTVPNSGTAGMMRLGGNYTAVGASAGSVRTVSSEPHWTDSVNGISTFSGGYFFAYHDGAGTDCADLFGCIGRAYITSTGTSNTGFWGTRGDFNFTGAGSAVSAVAVYGHAGTQFAGSSITTASMLKGDAVNWNTTTVQDAYGALIGSPSNATGHNIGVSIGPPLASSGSYIAGLVVWGSGVVVKGTPTVPPPADTSTANAYVVIGAGSNAGANDTLALLYFYRNQTNQGYIGYDADAATVIAGHTKVVGDFVLKSAKCVVDASGQIWTTGKVTATTALNVTTTALTTGNLPSMMILASAAHTGLNNTATQEVFISLGFTKQFTGGVGALATMYGVNITRSTYSAASAQTITEAATVKILGAPVAGTNMTLTNTWALLVGSGSSSFGGAIVQGHATAAINSTATATAAQVATGYITSTSAAPTTITLPTGTLLGAALAAVQGTIFDLYIDNTAGASTVTIAVAVNGIQSAMGGTLTVPSGVTGQACFRLMFSSATAYTFTRTA